MMSLTYALKPIINFGKKDLKMHHNFSSMQKSFEKAKTMLSREIAGEIVMSDNPGKVLQKWRSIFKISQRELAEVLKIKPSVISDYESGRRKSPGVKMIKKIVDALMEIDERKGGAIIREYSSIFPEEKISDAILSIKEFEEPISIEEFAKKINGEIVANPELKNRFIYGYTVVDSIKAIIELSPNELVKLYGLTTERAVVFTNISHGRSPFIAIKVTSLKPGVVVLHNIYKMDNIGKRIAEVEKIPVIISKIEDVDTLIRILNSFP